MNDIVLPGIGIPVETREIEGAHRQVVKEESSLDTKELSEAIHSLVQYLRILGVVRSNTGGGSLRVDISAQTLASLAVAATQSGTWNITTLTTLTNLAQLGGFPVNQSLPAQQNLLVQQIINRIQI